MGKTKKTAAFGLVLGGAMTVGVAFAAWTADGSGTGLAKAATVSPITTTKLTATVVGDLWPGGTGALRLAIQNPNKFPVKVTSIALDGTKQIVTSTGDCEGSNVSLTGATFDPIVVEADAKEQVITIPKAVLLAESAPTKCQGALFSIPVLISAETTVVTTTTEAPQG